MHLTVLAVGSRGDVQPLVALAEGFARAGYAVRVGTHGEFRELVEGRGLEFAPIGPDIRGLVREEAALAWVESRNPVSFFRRLDAVARPLGRALADDILRACAGTGAIVGSPLAASGFHVAEARGLPYLPALLQPASPTGAFASPLTPGLDWLPPPGRRLTHRLAALAFDLPWRRDVNAWRAQVLGLPPVRGLDFYGGLQRARWPVLYGFSPVVVPRPADWGPWLHVCGSWLLPDDPAWRPAAELRAFLDAGPPPVYVGFGSMAVRDPAATSETVVAALRQAGCRGLLGAGWAGLAAQGDDMLVVGEVPHAWLFPRCAAVVHHGGAGTTATALRAGVPSFAVPFFADQLFWGRRSARLGVGPDPIPVRRLRAGHLAAALRAAIRSPLLRRRAAGVGRALAAEDGVGTAVAVADTILHTR